MYTSTLRVSVYSHHYSPPLQGIVVYYFPTKYSGGSRGRGPGGGERFPLFLDQNKARRVEKIFLETAPPPPFLDQALNKQNKQNKQKTYDNIRLMNGVVGAWGLSYNSAITKADVNWNDKLHIEMP